MKFFTWMFIAGLLVYNTVIIGFSIKRASEALHITELTKLKIESVSKAVEKNAQAIIKLQSDRELAEEGLAGQISRVKEMVEGDRFQAADLDARITAMEEKLDKLSNKRKKK